MGYFYLKNRGTWADRNLTQIFVANAKKLKTGLTRARSIEWHKLILINLKEELKRF